MLYEHEDAEDDAPAVVPTTAVEHADDAAHAGAGDGRRRL